jgi:hypothetical protein
MADARESSVLTLWADTVFDDEMTAVDADIDCIAEQRNNSASW